MTHRKFIEDAFDPIDCYTDYPFLNDKFILANTRSGIAAAAALNVIKSFKLEENLDLLKKFVDYDIEMAIYLE